MIFQGCFFHLYIAILLVRQIEFSFIFFMISAWAFSCLALLLSLFFTLELEDLQKILLQYDKLVLFYR